MIEFRLLDFYCGAGGCSKGYQRVGFQPYGIDNDPKPLRHYPFPYVCMDALKAMERLLAGEGLAFSNGETLYLKDFDAFHASPPCKADNQAVLCRPNADDLRASYPRLIIPTRERLLETNEDKPFVIENVPLARRQLINPIMLCGTMFGLKVKRHRYFELHGFEILLMPAGCGCKGKAGFTNASSGFSSFANGAKLISVAGHNFSVEDARSAMGINWMGQADLSQAIPSIYTTYIGQWLMKKVVRLRG